MAFASRIALIAILAAPAAWALNPAQDVSQYAHKIWKLSEGIANSDIQAIRQSPDGYLWLATQSGLLRFDGIQRVSWPPPDHPLPSMDVISVLTSRDGTQWIGGRASGWLVSWKDGKMTQYHELDGQGVFAILED